MESVHVISFSVRVQNLAIWMVFSATNFASVKPANVEINACNYVLPESIVTELYVLLTVHLGIIFVNNQLDDKFLFHICLFLFSTCFGQPCAHHQEN